MKRSSLLGHTIELLDAIRTTVRPADAVVKDFFRSRHYLGAKDRRFIAEFVYGALRHYALLDAYVYAALATFDPHVSFPFTPSLTWVLAFALRVRNEPVHQLAEDARALWEGIRLSVPLPSFLDALASATLSPAVLTDPVRRIAVQNSTPLPLVQEWVERWGEREAQLLAESLASQAPITIRVNTLSSDVESCRVSLMDAGVIARCTSYSPVGLILEKRSSLETLEPYRKGMFEMQDEGSQLIMYLLEPHPEMTLLDACAGAGGKTLHAAAMMNNRGVIIASDTDHRRLRDLADRVSRAGVDIVRTVVATSDAFPLTSLRSNVDAVLVDAPCSGVGTYRRNPGLRMAYAMDTSMALARTQRSLLETYAPLVKPGGRLVYSTCTLVQAENEDVVHDFLKAHPEFRLMEAGALLRRQGVVLESGSPFLLLLPHRTGTDGFFAAAMERRGVEDAAPTAC